MEWLVTEDGKYKIVSLSAATFHGALRVMKESFCQDEIIHKLAEMDKDELAAEEMLELSADTALDGVSLVAVHIETEEVAAVALNKLLVATEESTEKPFYEIFVKERCKQPSTRALIECMGNLNGYINFFEKLDLDCCLDIMCVATLRHHRLNNLAMQLCKTSIEVARKLKDGPVAVITNKDLGSKYSFIPERKPTNKIPKFCTALWTSKGAQKIGKALGFDVHVRVPISDLNLNGKQYSKQLPTNSFIEFAAFIL